MYTTLSYPVGLDLSIVRVRRVLTYYRVYALAPSFGSNERGLSPPTPLPCAGECVSMPAAAEGLASHGSGVRALETPWGGAPPPAAGGPPPPRCEEEERKLPFWAVDHAAMTVRSRLSACVCSWQTRDSDTSSTRLISCRVRSSK